MATYDGNSVVATAYSGTKIVYTLRYYKLSLYDSLGVRHFWVDTTAVTTNAPALGAGTYDYATFVIEQVF